MISIRGIYDNLDESSIYLEIDDYTLYFSSDLNKFRFTNKYDEYYKRINARLNRIYSMDYLPLIIISLYKYVEKRGFRVYYKDRRLYDNAMRIEV